MLSGSTLSASPPAVRDEPGSGLELCRAAGPATRSCKGMAIIWVDAAAVDPDCAGRLDCGKARQGRGAATGANWLAAAAMSTTSSNRERALAPAEASCPRPMVGDRDVVKGAGDRRVVRLAA